MEKAMAPHSSTLAWKIPWTEEPGRLRSMGSLRVGHDWVTSLSLFTFMHWRRKWQPTPVFLPGESHGRACWAAVYGVAPSRTRLKWLSSSSSSSILSGIVCRLTLKFMQDDVLNFQVFLCSTYFELICLLWINLKARLQIKCWNWAHFSEVTVSVDIRVHKWSTASWW